MNASNLFRNWASLIIGVALAFGLLGYGITEEVPLGSLKGTIRMKENGKPLPNAMLTITRLPEDPSEEVRSRVVELDEKGSFQLRNLMAGKYEIHVSAKAHNLEVKQLEVLEGKTTPWEVEAAPVEPYLELYASQRVYTPDEKPHFELKGFVPDEKVRVVAYKLDFDKVIKEGSLYNALAPLARRDAKVQDPTTMGAKATQLDHSVERRDAEGTFIEEIDVNGLSEGLYWVEAYAGKIRRGTWFSVSRIATISKTAGKESVVYVTGIDSGQPVQGASVGFVSNGTYKEAAKTDSQGLARLTSTATGSGVMVAQFGASRGFVDFYTGEAEKGAQVRTVAYTDRPIYRPGDEVNFKGLIRNLVGSDYKVPEMGQVAVEIRDPDDSLLEKMSLPVSGMGSFSGKFTLNKESTPGHYAIVTTYKGAEQYTPVTVAAYRKPTYSIKVTPKKPMYVRGERAEMEITAEYYYGGPVAGAEVSASVYRESYWDPRLYGEEYAEYYADEEAGYSGYGGEYYEEIKVRTDENGKATISFDTRVENENSSYQTDYIYNVTVSVADEAGKYYDGQGSVKVMRGEYGVAIESERYIAEPGQAITAKIRAYSNADNKPVPNLEVRAVSGYERWVRNNSTFAEQDSQVVTTDANGEANVTFTPKGYGTYLLKVVTSDNLGNDITDNEYVWIEGGATEARSAGKLSIQLDKRQYKIGDTAKVLIQTDSPGGSALVAVEGDRVYTSRVVALNEGTTSFEMPIDKAYAPNAYVSVAYIKDKKYSDSSKRLAVDLGKKKLQVAVTSDKDSYKPGDSATYTIKTTNEDGEAVPAECSLAVVDESIYALAKDTTDLINTFYPKRYNSVSTNYSFPELYLDGGDKAPTSIEVRRRFKDTAYWAPVVQTSASGEATVTVPLPDNLTTWRATVAGITSDTAVGMTTSKAVSKKDLMVRLEAPTFLVSGDNQRLAAVVSNSTDQSLSVRVQLDSEAIGVEGQKVQTVTVGANSTQSVDWQIKPAASGTATLVAKAWVENGPNDGVELKIPVSPHGRAFVDQFSGEIVRTGVAKVTLRDGADPNSGRLRLTVTPSLASSLVQGLDELIGFPYGCTEQTMSRFMPTVVVSQALSATGLPRPVNADEIPAMVSEGYTRLYKMQHSDGGWGWWEYDDTDPFMTAYVLEGFKRAANAGYKPNATRLQKGLDAAEQALKTRVDVRTLDKYDRLRRSTEYLYLAYSLILHGRRGPAVEYLQSRNLNSMDHGDLAIACLAYTELGAGNESKKAEAAKLLTAKLTNSGEVAYWAEEFWGVETTARGLMALAAADGDNPNIPKIVRYLMRGRKGDMWFSTRDTAFALLGLVKHFQKTGELGQSGAVDVRVNGQQVRQIVVTPQTILGPDTTIEIPINQLKAGENTIEFQSTTKGTCYYAVDMRQTVVQDEIGQLVNADGLRVERKFYKLEPRRMENGTMKLMATDKPVDQADPGDIIRVELVITADKEFEYVMVEDPIPSGCRVTEREELGAGEEWNWWWSRLVILDDKVAFFSRILEKGQNKLSYVMRVENPGTSSALPTTVLPMYDPEIHASGSETRLEVGSR